MNILYVEDRDNFVRMMRSIVEHLGHQMLAARTGAEALALLDEHPALILTDISLPDMDGLALTRQFRALLPEVPVIAVTAHILPDERERCLDAGCADYVPKPFRVEAMLVLLKRYLTA